MEESKILIPDEVIINQIYLIRNQKVMIDRDLIFDALKKLMNQQQHQVKTQGGFKINTRQ